jgi:hypothetical protein
LEEFELALQQSTDTAGRRIKGNGFTGKGKELADSAVEGARYVRAWNKSIACGRRSS